MDTVIERALFECLTDYLHLFTVELRYLFYILFNEHLLQIVPWLVKCDDLTFIRCSQLCTIVINVVYESHRYISVSF